MNILELENLTVRFAMPEGDLTAVDQVSFRVPCGKVVALVGESGSGKSVISQAIMGLLPSIARIADGRLLFTDPGSGTDSEPVTTDIAAIRASSKAMRAIRGDLISLIFQEPMTSLSPLHTIGDQISEAILTHRRVARPEALEATESMLRLVRFPDPKWALKTYPFELSGGLRQRAMIAMALVCRPALLIADEPTTALDVTIQAQILKIVRDLQAELDMAVLIITHDLGVVANVADEVVVIYRGRLMEAGTAEDIFRHPRHPYLQALLNAVPRFDMKPGERLKPIRPIEPQSGGFLSKSAEQPAVELSTPLLRVEGISKTFRLRKSGLLGRGGGSHVTALDDVSFTVDKGECLGLVGESGCGKTTTAKVIMHALTPDQGRVIFNVDGAERNVHELRGEELLRYRRKVQFIFQDPFSSLNPRMTVFDILTEPYIIHGTCSKDEQFERVKELLRLVGLDVRHLRRYPHSFSGGQRQRIGIARALALKPELLLCDEPVSALDVSVQAQVLNLLKDLQSELGLTYIFVSHNLAVVDYIADRIAVMCKGRIVEIGPKADLVNKPAHPYTKALYAAVPEPNLDHPLDFSALLGEEHSNPAIWDPPFRMEDGVPPNMIEISPGHLVCAPGWAKADISNLLETAR